MIKCIFNILDKFEKDKNNKMNADYDGPKYSCPEDLDKILQSGYEVDRITSKNSGTNLLSNVSMMHDHRYLSVVLKYKPNIHFKDNHECTALLTAAFFGFKKNVAILLNHGANINDTEKAGLSSLHCAVNINDYKMVKFLLKNGANPSITDNRGISPLNIALNHSFNKIAKLLIEHGADVNNICEFSSTPLFAAIENKNEEMIYVLLKKDVNLNIIGLSRLSILETAISKELHPEIIKKLLQKGASIDIMTTRNKTIYEWVIDQCISSDDIKDTYFGNRVSEFKSSGNPEAYNDNMRTLHVYMDFNIHKFMDNKLLACHAFSYIKRLKMSYILEYKKYFERTRRAFSKQNLSLQQLCYIKCIVLQIDMTNVPKYIIEICDDWLQNTQLTNLWIIDFIKHFNKKPLSSRYEQTNRKRQHSGD